MNRGYVCLWRKSLDSGWIKNHKLWAFWSYCLMKASHKEYDAIVGHQVVHLMPGQFIFGRKKAASETGLTEQEIRTNACFLKRNGNLTIKSTNKYSIVTVINWGIYQPVNSKNNQQPDQQVTNKEPHTIIKTQKNIYPPEFYELIERYSDTGIIYQAIDAIKSTRKTNRVSPNVIVGQAQEWDRFPAEHVEHGMRVYLEKRCAAQGKGEKYLLGIIRNHNEAELKKQSNPDRVPEWL